MPTTFFLSASPHELAIASSRLGLFVGSTGLGSSNTMMVDSGSLAVFVGTVAAATVPNARTGTFAATAGREEEKDAAADADADDDDSNDLFDFPPTPPRSPPPPPPPLRSASLSSTGVTALERKLALGAGGGVVPLCQVTLQPVM
mmetsp:Transcript_73132/g.143089  ORF Transcript_73132/g.143089 Transcript_73132/m.143089 type:complete len:145 (-) Transcript_73132:1031-1465(-)